jgi:hypothetical protein
MENKMNEAFIAFDWCGWNENYGRFSHMPSCETLIQEGWMNQRDWDEAQLRWFEKFPGLTVCRCPRGPYLLNDDIMGTTDEICTRLKARLN